VVENELEDGAEEEVEGENEAEVEGEIDEEDLVDSMRTLDIGYFAEVSTLTY